VPETGTVVVTLLILLVSALYASVGQAGGSGYLAVMAYMNVAPDVMRPTALVLNVLVAGIATVRLWRSRPVRLSLAWPLMVASVPSAIVGGALHLPRAVYNPLVGAALLLAALPLIRPDWLASDDAAQHDARVSTPLALAAGAGTGLLAGLTGTGGGIFLSPLLLLAGWASIQETRAISTVFILVNSGAALLANAASVGRLPGELPIWATAALVGGLLGADLGTRWLSPKTVLRVLALVHITGGLKLIIMP
jgi:uncharacterized membrane protein YfcA